MTHPRGDDRLERTVQLTGGSTYTVSLPKAWAKHRGIEPGVAVTLYPREHTLVLNRGPETDDSRSVTVPAGAYDADTLARGVGAAYIGGADKIVLAEPRDTTKRRTATQAVRQFVGLEVLAEDENGLTAQTMLDALELSPARAIEQMRRTSLAMHRDAVAAVVTAEDDPAGIDVDAEDDTVDRLFALVSREFHRSLVDPETPIGRSNGLSSFEYYAMARQLERIADHAKKVAAIAAELETAPDAEITAQLQAHGEAARAIVADALDGSLEGTERDLVAVIDAADELLGEIEGLDERLYRSQIPEGYRLGVVLDSLVRTVGYGVNIAEAGLRAQYRADSWA